MIVGSLCPICVRTIRYGEVSLVARVITVRLDAYELLGEEVILLCGLNN